MWIVGQDCILNSSNVFRDIPVDAHPEWRSAIFKTFKSVISLTVT